VNVLIEQPDVMRVGNRLHVVWSQQDNNGRSVRTRLLTLQGKIASPTRPVVTQWLAVVEDPKLVRSGTGELLSVFAGIRSGAPGDPYVGPAVHSSSPDGLNWTLEPGSLSQTTAAGNSETMDVINASGAPLFAMGGFGGHVIMHRGISPNSPASTPDFFSTQSPCCPATAVALANDTATDQTWASWLALGATDRDEAGIFMQKVWPRPNGPLLQAPGSAGPSRPASLSVPVAIVARAGGGTWAAYSVGASRIRVWKVGTPRRWLDIKTGPGLHLTVAIAAAPGGRLWIAWEKPSSYAIQAVRTNRLVTRVGRVRTLLIPGARPGSPGGQLNTMSLNASLGPLVVVAGSQPPGSGSNGLYAARVLPQLSVAVSPRRVARGRVVVTVRDAGDPVAGARVALRGRVVRTNALGRAGFRISRAVPDGRYVVTATKPFYARASARLRVT
jgi:hypothetical protein